MDTLLAALYDEEWGVYDNGTHQLFIQEFLSLLPQPSAILDAACDTGTFWPMLLEKGHAVVGTDQSQGMLSRARATSPSVPAERVGLQELHLQGAFDGIICVDATEFVFPEDWPVVLRHFYRTLRPDGQLYFTVELADASETKAAFEDARQMCFPVAYGEWAHEGGYHDYPEVEEVLQSVQLARFRLTNQTVGDDTHHSLVQKQKPCQ
jgi:SAM-dependent methyltransferase